MTEHTEEPAGQGPQTDEDVFWNTSFYQRLLPVARGWTYRANMADWKGQENDIAEEILSTTAVKLIQYMRTCRAAGIPIDSLEHLSMRIAHRSFLDMRRHDARLQRFPQTSTSSTEPYFLEIPYDPIQEVEDKIYMEWLFSRAAHKIAGYPGKTKIAILIDLARLSGSGLLENAFREAGIHLQDYRSPASDNPRVRGRQSALRSLGYKRLKKELGE